MDASIHRSMKFGFVKTLMTPYWEKLQKQWFCLMKIFKAISRDHCLCSRHRQKEPKEFKVRTCWVTHYLHNSISHGQKSLPCILFLNRSCVDYYSRSIRNKFNILKCSWQQWAIIYNCCFSSTCSNQLERTDQQSFSRSILLQWRKFHHLWQWQYELWLCWR